VTPLEVIVTVPPHADFLEEVARHPAVTGLRLNTVMPLAEPVEAALARLAALGPPLWIDLKGRQLRVREAAVPPFTAVRLSHRVRVRTPTRALFGDGREEVRVLAVDGDRLVLEDGPRRVLGPGEAVNIPDASLVVEGGLTATDREYLAAARALGLCDVMLSFVEGGQDVEEVLRLHPQARVVAKVESRRGLAWARAGAPGPQTRLMAARGDLFLELHQPHHLPRALRAVVSTDPAAIAASRLLSSLAWGEGPTAAEVTDVAYLLALGYRALMLGDAVCLRRESVLDALDLVEALAREAPRPSAARPVAASAR